MSPPPAGVSLPIRPGRPVKELPPLWSLLRVVTHGTLPDTVLASSLLHAHWKTASHPPRGPRRVWYELHGRTLG